MKSISKTLGILLFLFILLLISSLFTIIEGQQGLILRLGHVLKEDGQVKVFNPGLHFKTPFIESVRIFDTRIQTIDIKSMRIITKEKNDVVLINYYVKWQIDDLAKYFMATDGNDFKAKTLLEQQLNSLLRMQFGKRTVSELVSENHNEVISLLRTTAEQQAREIGLKIIDVQIKGIEPTANTRNAIYQNMRIKMQNIANQHRADGKAMAEEVKAKADAQVMVLIATSKSEAQKARAIGQAKAAEIYTEAYSKDKDFFALYRSLLAYEKSFQSKKDILVLDQSSAFFDYFKQATPKNDGVSIKK
ncbi:MAG: protease modulator HflC [Legionella sp.]|uniref:protease modulator HflC n=1 Tax=Legionella sp. TaxID=459 RepID=UPI0039E4782A